MLLIMPFFFVYVDGATVDWVNNTHQSSVFIRTISHYASRLMHFISDGATLIAFSFVLYLIGRFYQNTGLHKAGKSLLVGLLSAGITVQILKHLIGRARPRVGNYLLFIGPTFQIDYDSFPSGHTTMAFCLAVVLSDYAPRYSVLFYLFALLIGIYRIDVLAHFPSDVLAGALVGSFVGKLVLLKMSYPKENRYD